MSDISNLLAAVWLSPPHSGAVHVRVWSNDVLDKVETLSHMLAPGTYIRINPHDGDGWTYTVPQRRGR